MIIELTIDLSFELIIELKIERGNQASSYSARVSLGTSSLSEPGLVPRQYIAGLGRPQTSLTKHAWWRGVMEEDMCEATLEFTEAVLTAVLTGFQQGTGERQVTSRVP